MTDNAAYPARRLPLAEGRMVPRRDLSEFEPVFKDGASEAIRTNPAYPMRRLPYERTATDARVDAHIAAKLKLARRIEVISGIIDGPHAADLLRVSTALHLTLQLLHDVHVKGEGGPP